MKYKISSFCLIVCLIVCLLLGFTSSSFSCDCSFSAITGTSNGSTQGNPNVSIQVTDPGVNIGDAVVCALGYDNYSHGAQPPDNTWTDLGDFQLADETGESIFLQYYPGSYPTATFANDSGLTAENWSYACIAESYRYGVDGIVSAIASSNASLIATAPSDAIVYTLDSLLNIFTVTGPTIMSSPNFGSFVAQQNSFGPAVGIVSSRNPPTSPTLANSVALNSPANSSGASVALRCAAAPSVTPTVTATTTATPTGGATPTATPTSSPGVLIKHVVLLIKENQTYDRLFGTFPGGNGVTVGKIPGGTPYNLTEAPNQPPNDYGHTYGNALTDIDGGKMDGFGSVGGCLSTDSTPYSCLSQYYQSDVPNYWRMAQAYALGDNMYAGILGPSLPNHMELLAASSFNVDSNANATGTSDSWGCDAPLKATDCTANGVPAPQCTGLHTCPTCTATTSAFVSVLGSSSIFPCFTQNNILDEMNTASVTWKYYGINSYGSNGYFWTTPNSFKDSTNGTTSWTNNVVNDQQFFTDAAAGNLPQFAMISTASGWSDHSPAPICTGENYAVAVYNAVTTGPEASTTLLIMTWDEWGGLYDHVVPPTIDGLGLSIRVPILVISPYAVNSVIHTQVEHASIIKELEEIFSLPSLGNRDANPATNDLSTFLNLSQTPIVAPILTQRPTSGQPVVCQPASQAP